MTDIAATISTTVTAATTSTVDSEEWKAIWKGDRQSSQRYDPTHSYGIEQATADALETLILHYPWIVYLGYSLWRKCLIRVWLMDEGSNDDDDDNLPSLMRLPLPHPYPSPVHLGMQGALGKASRLRTTTDGG